MSFMDRLLYAEKFKADTSVTKTRIFIVNSKNKILLCNYAGVFMLPGGKLEKDESLLSCIRREVLEEVGLDIPESKIYPFAISDYLVSNYKTRRNTTENREIFTFYFFTYLNNNYKINPVHLTDSENNSKFKTMWVSPLFAKFLINFNIARNPRNKHFKKEINKHLTVYNNFAKILRRKKKKAVIRVKV